MNSTFWLRLCRTLRRMMVAALIAAAPNALPAQEPGSLDELLSAVVGVHAAIPADARTAATLGTDRFGSGVVIDGSGLIVTIGYLILEAEQVTVVLDAERRVPADILAYDYESGFGLLRAAVELDLRPMPLGVSTEMKPGDKLFIASFGGVQTVAPAIFAEHREFAGYWEYLIDDAMFTVPPYPAFGGAALISPAGNLIGIGSLTVGDAVRDDQLVPGNMFLPIDRLKKIMGDLLTIGRSSGAQNPWIGVYLEEFDSRLLVRRVAPDGPAAAAGMAPGDVIAATGGYPVNTLGDFYRRLWAQGAPGDKVSVTVIRDSGFHELEIFSGDRYDWLRIGKN